MQSNSRIPVPRRLSPRWPPVTVYPTQTGFDEYNFHIVGQSAMSIGAIALAVATSITLIVAQVWNMLTLPLLLVGAALLVVFIAATYYALSYRVSLAIDLHSNVAITTKSACGISWFGATARSNLSLQVARVTLVRSGQLGESWSGYGICCVGDGRILFTSLLTRSFKEVEVYIDALPDRLRQLIRESEQAFVARL